MLTPFAFAFSSIVLMTVSAKLINDSGDEKSTLSLIHDYLESRQTLLKTIPVGDSSLLPSLLLSVALVVTCRLLNSMEKTLLTSGQRISPTLMRNSLSE